VRARSAPLALLGALGLAIAGGCFNANDAATCGRFCDLAATCGMLPSPLGLDRDDCASRCAISDGVSFTTLTDCWRRAAPDAGTANLWCQASDGPPVCAAFDACIESSYPGADVTGQSSLRVAFVPTPPANPAVVARDANDGMCEVSPSISSPPPTADACAALHIQSMTILVEERAETVVTTLPCSSSTLQDLVIPGLHPGALRPIVELLALPDSGSAQCRRFYGPRVVVAADHNASSAVPIPTTGDLFVAGAACRAAGGAAGPDGGT
jgi:hypothetical protein